MAEQNNPTNNNPDPNNASQQQQRPSGLPTFSLSFGPSFQIVIGGRPPGQPSLLNGFPLGGIFRQTAPALVPVPAGAVAGESDDVPTVVGLSSSAAPLRPSSTAPPSPSAASAPIQISLNSVAGVSEDNIAPLYNPEVPISRRNVADAGASSTSSPAPAVHSPLPAVNFSRREGGSNLFMEIPVADAASTRAEGSATHDDSNGGRTTRAPTPSNHSLNDIPPLNDPRSPRTTNTNVDMNDPYWDLPDLVNPNDLPRPPPPQPRPHSTANAHRPAVDMLMDFDFTFGGHHTPSPAQGPPTADGEPPQAPFPPGGFTFGIGGGGPNGGPLNPQHLFNMFSNSAIFGGGGGNGGAVPNPTTEGGESVAEAAGDDRPAPGPPPFLGGSVNGAPPELRNLLASILQMGPMGAMGPGFNPNDPNSGGSFVLSFSLDGPPFGAMMQDEKRPDPERAQELIDALDVVDETTLRRWDRVLKLETGNGWCCGVCMDGLDDNEETNEEVTEPAVKEQDKARAATVGDEKDKKDEEAASLRKENEDEQMKDKTKDTEVVALPCSHSFHHGCLKPWLLTATSCPECRFDLDPLSTTLRRQPQQAGPQFFNTVRAGSPMPGAGRNRQHPYQRPATPSNSQFPSELDPRRGAGSSNSTRTEYRPPPAPSQNLDSKLQSLEYKHGLRCSCSDCFVVLAVGDSTNTTEDHKKQLPIRISLLKEDSSAGCEHLFHSACLRVSSRIQGLVKEDDGTSPYIDVMCPIRGCHGSGRILRQDWERESDVDADVMEMQHQKASGSVVGAGGGEDSQTVDVWDLD